MNILYHDKINKHFIITLPIYYKNGTPTLYLVYEIEEK